MNIQVTKVKNGAEICLTTDSPASRYGIPVLRITGNFTMTADFGPADLVGTPEENFTPDPAAEIVYAWAVKPGRKREELKAARLFLRQWPEGPQLPEGLKA